MGLINYMAKEAMKEIGNKSREFFEFVLPPVDLTLEEDQLVVTVDMPGFEKKDIKLRMHGNILSINAKKPEKDQNGTVIWNQRPNLVDKKIRLPGFFPDEEEDVSSAKYANGVLTIVIPTKKHGKHIPVE